ncbi:MAG: aminoacyl-tRNA hydrolase [Deltaproteobacteria bacterium RBG_16_58_17]|nr:MAG: aminoacyl-tRNA hydrolase [Deltaproteobacteria bacterium RBG_16_58_17]OHE17197.1 MAG: aminoacyl-tRNA hydrolase [Syntrophobacterales bacterium GWC2_56_13]OHE21269.1 MAG: aminoacyl-tRNA hydrolase [Syntrophobacterales bacterium GWF2_56_9]
MNFVVGLGNPGIRYQLSRHNAGFLVLDQLALQHDISINQTIFDARIGKGKIAGGSVLLAKPQTFMNLSGAAVGKLADYFRTDLADLIVVHDDMDLPFQTIRLKSGGGHGGHKGLISIIDHLGGTDFTRVRFGIGRPARKSMVEGYVLEPFSEEEVKSVSQLIRQAAEAVTDIVSSGVQAAMEKHHRKDDANLIKEV